MLFRSDDVAGIVDHFAAHGRGIRLQSKMCSDPGSALVHATAHILFTDLGSPDAQSHEMLLLCLSQHHRAGTEMLPFQQLEHLWLEPIATGEPAENTAISKILASSCVSRPIDCLTASTLDLYQITHTVLFATDLGQRPIDLPQDRAEFFTNIEALLAVALDAENYDLVAELLWVWPMLHQHWSPIALCAFDVIDTLASQRGFLPGPDYRTAHDQGLAPTEQEQYRARTSYHTTLAMGILCAAVIRSGTLPDEMQEKSRQDINAGMIIGRMTGSGTTKHWLTVIELAQGRVDRILAPLVVTAYLRRARASNDFAGIAAGLQFAVQHYLTELPAVRLAQQFLERAALLSRLMAS